MVGTCRPSFSAALRIVVPAGTVTGVPSMVRLMSLLAIHYFLQINRARVRAPCCLNPTTSHGYGHGVLSNISGHNFIALSTAVGAVWPRPQSDASIIVAPISDKRS